MSTTEQRQSIARALRRCADMVESGEDDLVQFYSDGVGGLEWHSSIEEAEGYAERELQGAADDAPDDGWPDDIESVSWGVLVPIKVALPVSRRKSCDPKSTEIVKFELMSPDGFVAPKLDQSLCDDDECETCYPQSQPCDELCDGHGCECCDHPINDAGED